MTQTTWPAPAPPSERLPVFRRSGGKFILVACVAAVVGLATVSAVTQKDSPSSGGSFYASPGWTIQRAADLSVKIEYDDGVSRPRADCAMKAIVGVTTWLEWQSYGSAGQLSVIRAAEGAC